MQPKSIAEVAEGHLCCGCGACAYLEPESITMVDIVDRGLRPLVAIGATTKAETLQACPGAGLEHTFDQSNPDLAPELINAWGPVLGVWEGYATDEQTRFSASSGGAATALAAHCLTVESMAGVLHIGSRPDKPYLNHTIFSTSHDELRAATGSRYAPASPCDRLDLIENADSLCVFIGKPCDVAAAASARKIRPRLDANLGLTIAMFCAGTPSTRGTLEMMAQMGIEDLSSVTGLRYRGEGWPGRAKATHTDGKETSLSYEQSWGEILQKHRQWRCHVCIDHTGEFADVAVGDPWYQEVDGSDAGRSLIVARTERGREIIESAIDNGLLTAWSTPTDLLPRSQPNLKDVRGSVWGRLLTLRVFRAYAPTYTNMPMFDIWLRDLSPRAKVSSFVGTARRVFRKNLRKRIPVQANQSEG